MVMNLMFSCPILMRGLSPAATTAAWTIIGGVAIAYFVWLYLYLRLSQYAGASKARLLFCTTAALIPGINALWVPWAFISSVGYVQKAQDNYHRVNVYHSGSGVRILSIPILVLYLFWGVLGFIMRKSILSHYHDFDVMLSVGIIVVCVLIIFLVYLVHLSLLVSKIQHYKKYQKLRNHNHK